MEQSMPYTPPAKRDENFRAAVLENHWDSVQVTMAEAVRLREDPTRYINDLLYENGTLRQDRDHYASSASAERGRRCEAEQRWLTLQSQWVRETKATDALSKIRILLQEITDHQGRCAAKDICSDHEKIVTLAKVVKEWIEENS